ncbi:MAG: hypoxanthine phosphoribosyltransferase [Oscillospiraceae bacterium]
MYDDSFIISEEDIKLAVKKLAEKISKDYKNKPLIAICVLKGAIIFYSDLIRYIDTPIRMDFVAVSSYGSDTKSSGKINFRARTHTSDEELKKYHILLVEDIVDTGNTLYWLKDYFNKKNPLSVKICTLIDKPSRRVVDLTPDYTCFSIPDKFIVGYGLDYDELYREMPYISSIDYAEKHYHK